MTKDLAIDDEKLKVMGEAANYAAKQTVFDEYRSQDISDNTRIRQDRDLKLFAEYLNTIGGVEVGDLAGDPQAWRRITWGLAKGYKHWLVREGYSISTVNVRLSTIRRYAELAYKSEVLSHEEYTRIAKVKGFKRQAGLRIDETRDTVRRGPKKAEQNTLTPSDMDKLISALPDTPQGRRDRLLLALMCSLGLRVGEVAALTRDNFDLEAQELTFYRTKVGKTQTHKLINGSHEAALAYINQDAPAEGIIWRGSVKASGSKHTEPGSGNLSDHQGLSERAIKARVKLLGRVFLGIDNLSPHDLRHSWATRAARRTSIDKLMEAGGWSSYAMPLRYIEASKIANEGVKLD